MFKQAVLAYLKSLVHDGHRAGVGYDSLKFIRSCPNHRPPVYKVETNKPIGESCAAQVFLHTVVLLAVMQTEQSNGR